MWGVSNGLGGERDSSLSNFLAIKWPAREVIIRIRGSAGTAEFAFKSLGGGNKLPTTLAAG
jgi:hypothetical protein